jgi:hypothetical protein
LVPRDESPNLIIRREGRVDNAESPRQRASAGRRLLLGLGAVSFLVRLGAVAATLGLSTPPAPGSDELEYDTYAWNMVQGRGYRGPSPDVEDKDHITAYRAPGPSLYYAAIYRAVGHHYPAAHACNALLGALTVLLVFGIARRCFGTKAAWMAAGGGAAPPLPLPPLPPQKDLFAGLLVRGGTSGLRGPSR